MRRIGIGIGLLSLSCASSDTRGFVEVAELPDDFPYLGSGHTAWISGRSLLVEVEQVAGINVAEIGCRVSGDDLHLEPVRVSSGGSRVTAFEIALPGSRSPDFWASHLFWVTRRTYTPFWMGGPKEPSERVAVAPALLPFKAAPSPRITSECR